MVGELVEYAGAGGRSERATFWAAGAEGGKRAGVLLLDERDAFATRFVEQGFAVLVPRSAWSGAPDRAALADIEAALAWFAKQRGVDASKLAVVGYARGGTLAFMLACTSRRVAAAVDIDGPVVYAELSAARPAQPLEFALNLSVPLLVVAREDEQLRRLRRLLEQGAKHVEFVERDEDGARTISFLREVLEVED